jgi:photosystem II stability/assembly factor-like uncharacterized protein
VPRETFERLHAVKFPNHWFMRQRLSGDPVPVRALARALDDYRRVRARRDRATEEAGVDEAPGSWAFAGPINVGGRVTALAVDPNNANRIWLGAAAGGVWLSEDGGVSWTSVFDTQTAQSIGSLAAHPTDSNIVYVGTGEDNGGGYSYDGEGVFKTVDGGQTWTPLGLAETRRIGGIAIDPVNPDRVFVAAGGDVFRQDEHRGVYRSTDGGQTWQKVLFVANDTGAIDVAIDPGTPNRVYAAMWTRQSTATSITFGGPNGGVWQSTDGGDTWTELAGGLPTTSIGRIGLAIAKTNPSIVFARYQNATGTFKGIWKTTNAGASWSRSDANGIWRYFMSSYGYYFGEIRVDPQNANRVYLLDVYWFLSTDGGVNFTQRTSGLHVDHHDLILQPSRLLMGNDGGFYSSTDGGNTWTHAVTLGVSQAYDLAIDNLQPQRRFMGLQDNGTVRTVTGGTSDWIEVLGGDGLQCEVDPTNSNLAYASSQGGAIARSTDGGDSFTGATTGIDSTERVNWNAPVTHDPLATQRLYTGTIRVYRSTDGAVSWQSLSPDLTNGASDGGAVAGGGGKLGDLRSHLADTVDGTVTTIGVSPVDTGIVWAGTDDGNVWVTQNAGGSWTQVNVPGRTEWVTRVSADPFEADSAYVTFSGFRNGSKMPHVFRTTDLGVTWQDIVGDLPDVPLNDVVPDPEWQGRLFAGSDLGVFLTDSWGRRWEPMNGGLPIVVIHDLVLHDPTRTLYAATHARSLWRFDLGQLPVPDRDLDGVNNLEDCAPDDEGAFALPGELSGLLFQDDAQTLEWNPVQPGAGSGTVHDVLRGALEELPVGAGASELCVASGVAGTSASDAAEPPSEGGFWYLVRARNACGAGTYGSDSTGSERTSSACP